MIVIKLISGLGNQLFQYAIARQLSLKNDTPLKIDISFFGGQKLRSYKLDNYNIRAEIATSNEIESLLLLHTSDSFYAKVYRRIGKYIPKYKKTIFKEETWWLYEPDLFKTSKNVYLEGYWQHYKYFEHIDPIILDELTLKYPLTEQEENFSNKINSKLESISVHVRRGDYITDSNANNLMGVLSLVYYQQSIDYLNKNLSSPYYFIFSDDLAWVKENLKITNNVTFIDIEGGTRDYIELDLMSKCKHNIIANSSFSWWGAFLNRNPNKIVIAPKQWVLPNDINDRINIQLPSWIKM